MTNNQLEGYLRELDARVEATIANLVERFVEKIEQQERKINELTLLIQVSLGLTEQ